MKFHGPLTFTNLQLIRLPYHFTELFEFKYGGGQKGLYLDFDFVSKEKFKFEKCEFLIKDSKTNVHGVKSYTKQTEKKKLRGLDQCTKYDVVLSIQNVATKKVFNYQNIVFTKVDSKVAKLELRIDKVENDSARLSWNLVDFSCITSYKLVVINSRNESAYEDAHAKDGFAVVKNLALCDIYSAHVIAISARDEKILSPTKTFILKSHKSIENLNLVINQIDGGSVALSWTSDLNCSQEYQINLRNIDDKIVYSANVFSNSTVISNLTSCSNYSAELIALDDNKLAVIKTFVTHSLPLENVKIVVSGSKAKISWTTLSKLDCIESLIFSYVIEDCNFDFDDSTSCSRSETVDKSISSHTLSSLPLAERFSLAIYANEGTSESAKHVKNFSFNTIGYEKFYVQNINEFRLETTLLQLSWSLDNRLLKILQNFEISFDEKTFTTNKNLLELSIAACKKNYTISIQCVSKDGLKGPAVTYQTNLNDDAIPLYLLDNSIKNHQVNESVTISWTPKKEEETCIAHYEIDFNDQNFKTRDTRTEINDFAPCITYEIVITPISHRGKRGISSTFEFTTQEFCK